MERSFRATGPASERSDRRKIKQVLCGDVMYATLYRHTSAISHASDLGGGRFLPLGTMGGLNRGNVCRPPHVILADLTLGTDVTSEVELDTELNQATWQNVR